MVAQHVSQYSTLQASHTNLSSAIQERHDRITSLESVPSSSQNSIAPSDRASRKQQRGLEALEREVASLQAHLEANDDLLAEKDEEIQGLRSRMPLPSSPSARPVVDSTEQIETLENIIRSLDSEKENLLEEQRKLEQRFLISTDERRLLLEESADLRRLLEQNQADFSIRVAEIATATEKMNHLSMKLESRSHEDFEFDDLLSQAKALSETKIDLESRLGNLMSELEEAQSAQSTLETQLRDKAIELSTAAAQLDTARSDHGNAVINVAQLKDEEISQLKLDLQTRQTALDETKAEHAAAHLARSRDLKDARTIVAQLTETIAGIEASVSEGGNEDRAAAIASKPTPYSVNASAQALHAKIDRLRSERDELRQGMSFAQHEHRFSISALQAERIQAETDLNGVRVALTDKLASLDSIQKEAGEAKEQLEELTVRLDAARLAFDTSENAKETVTRELSDARQTLEAILTERETLRAELADLESRMKDAAAQAHTNLTEQAAESQDLVSRLAVKDHETSQYRRDLQDANKTNKLLHGRVVKLEADLATANGGTDEASGPRRGHKRTISGMSSTFLTELRAEKEEMVQRISRRDGELICNSERHFAHPQLR